MKLINEKKKALTIIYQGKRVVVYPGQIIEGPVQLTIYGLTPLQTNMAGEVSAVIPSVEQKVNSYKTVNDIEVDKAIKYIQSYNKERCPSVAICILTKDSYALISDCIESIERHVEYPNTEIYIFDTGTTDPQTLEYYTKKIASCRFPLTIASVGEFHFSRNYNAGLKKVTSEYYLIQNNDTVALNDYVSKLMRVAILDKVGACGPRMLYKDGRIQHDGQVIYNHQDKGFGSPTHVNLGRNPHGVPTGRLPADGITCAGMLVRSSVYWEAGGLNERYHDIFQDVELNIKIRMNGHAIICDRDALIHHYDNTSRNHFWAQNVEKLKLKHLDYSLLFGKFNNDLKYAERFKKRFSIVTLVNNEQLYLDFLNDLKKQECNFDFEIIALPNFNNEYTSCAEALNIGLDVAEGEYIFMAHQDLRAPENWLENVMDHIKNLIASDVKFGVLGMAGSWVNNASEGGVIYLTGNEDAYKGTPYETKAEVQCLDELCLIVRRNNDFRFDVNTCNGYHCYGTDLCLNYLTKGYRNFAINAPCTHLSDGFKNISNVENLHKFTECTFNVFKKWRGIVPAFRNTTARFSTVENSVKFYVATELNKRGVPLKPVVILQD
jgi:GT2 family glycosyltransferase